MLSEQDKELVDRMIVLENLMLSLEKDHQMVAHVPFKIPETYQLLLEQLMDMVRKDMVALKVVFREERLKILDVREDNGFTQYQYMCKGYQSIFRYWSYAMDTKVLKAMEYYMHMLKNN